MTIPDLIAEARKHDAAMTYAPWSEMTIAIGAVLDQRANREGVAWMRNNLGTLVAEVERLRAENAEMGKVTISSFAAAAPEIMWSAIAQDRGAYIEHLRSLLERIVKYVHEDKARTPGSTRLERVMAEARAALAGKDATDAG